MTTNHIPYSRTLNLSPPFSGYIRETMNNFDFKKVHRIMKAIKWEWDFGGNPRVPEIDEIVQEGYERLVQSYVRALENAHAGNKKEGICDSGGLRAECNLDDNWITLQFVAVEWEEYAA